jgi:cellulose synthase/poly-beta-1,6-N-acetylglucosamine synthase-like glycosyltransferase
MRIRNEALITVASLGFFVTAFALFLVALGEADTVSSTSSASIYIEKWVFLVIVTLLLSGNLVYQLARLGYLRRIARHHALSHATLEAIYDATAPSVAILIPTYKEEQRVLRQTILSAALCEYPARRIAVLIDDPPDSLGPDAAGLRTTRRLVVQLHERFEVKARWLQREQHDFLCRMKAGLLERQAEAEQAARLYEGVAEWLDEWATRFESSAQPAFAHVDRLFVEKVLRAPAADHRACAMALRSAPPDEQGLMREYRRLASLLHVEIKSFERKRYANLSHQANKAMNLNSYIGLMGRSFREVKSNAQPYLVECEASEATFAVPDAEYLLTLDADSIVLPDYALRLTHILMKNPRVAVAQTPYSAFPGAPGLLERVAGATTDIQYIIHQGFTRFAATYWVGANAMLRLSALRDICTYTEERGYRLPVFIQERTVIEDTGSTIDLVRRGWTLYNYPERLAYSATPPDFGSLVIQRRRWSNGGLVILADLVRYLRRAPKRLSWLAEALMRAHYLCSPAIANIGLLALLLYPFDDGLASIWLPLTAVPYYFLYGRDLTQAGYRWLDLVRVYALNLALVPVNLAGVLRSLQQLVTGRKSAFGRTPKIEGRTASPPVHLLFQWAMIAYLVILFGFDVEQGRHIHAMFTLANVGLYAYALTQMLGCRESIIDLCAALAPHWQALVGYRSLWPTASRDSVAAPNLAPGLLPLDAASRE